MITSEITLRAAGLWCGVCGMTLQLSDAPMRDPYRAREYLCDHCQRHGGLDDPTRYQRAISRAIGELSDKLNDKEIQWATR